MLSTVKTPVVQSIDLATGVTLQFVEQGDPAGLPAILLHGFTDSWHSYERVLPLLPPAVHAFALSQRGHGDSSRPASGYGAPDFAADLAAFMDALGLRSAVIVGHSMGSTVAQRFALDFPERVRGLLLAGSATTWHNPAVLDLAEVIATLDDPIDPAFVREFQQSTIARPVPAAFLETVIAESMKVPARVWQAALLEAHLGAGLATRLSAIQAPTLVIWGDRDAIHPRLEQERLVAAIPSARLVIYPGTGHALHWEEPDRFAADLAAFVASLAE